MAEAVGRDARRRAYGQVPLPGRDSVNLPAGDVIIFYGERTAIEHGRPLARSAEPELRVRTTNGQLLLGSTPYVFDQFDDGDYVRRADREAAGPRGGRLRGGLPDHASRVPSTP